MPSIKYEIDLDRDNGSGTYYVYWRDGRQKRASLRTKDRDEAEKNFLEFLIKRGINETTAAKNNVTYTIADLWPVYWSKQLLGTASEKSAMAAWPLLKAHFGGRTVSEIDQRVVDDYIEKRTSGRLAASRLSGRTHVGQVLPQTVRKELTYLIACMRFCSLKKHGQNLFDPNLIERIRKPEEGDPKDRWLRDGEIEALHDAAFRLRKGERISREERFLYLGLNTAARETAIYDLTWDRIDFEQRTIDLRVASVVRANGQKRRLKNRASVPMSDDLYVFLTRCYVERINDLVMDSKKSIWRAIQLVVVEAGLAPTDWKPSKRRANPPKTGIGPHVLRHTAATHMARAGVPLWKVANILGNTLAVTEKVYANFCPDEQSRAAVNVMKRGLRLVKSKEEIAR